MFRQQLQQTDSEWFLSRVCELPVVHSAVDQLSGLYSGVKQHNRLFRFTLDSAEGGVSVVVNKARPVVAKFDKPIGALNTIACQQLDKLEHDYPIITKPTDEVMKDARQLCDNAVKPLVDRVAAVKQFSVSKVTGVKTYTTDKLNGVKCYSVNTLSSVSHLGTKQLNKVLDTSLCQHVVTKLDTALNIADQYVDIYLPEVVAESDEKCESAVSTERSTVYVKARSISGKLRRRMFARLATQLSTVQVRSTETIKHFNFTVNLIEYSRGTVSSARDKAMYVWTEVNKSEEDVAREMTGEEAEMRLHSDSTFERKALATVRHLTQKTKQAMTSVGFPVENLPGALNSVLDSAGFIKLYISNSLKHATLPNLQSSLDYLTRVVHDYYSLVHQGQTSVYHWISALQPHKPPNVWSLNVWTRQSAAVSALSRTDVPPVTSAHFPPVSSHNTDTDEEDEDWSQHEGHQGDDVGQHGDYHDS